MLFSKLFLDQISMCPLGVFCFIFIVILVRNIWRFPSFLKPIWYFTGVFLARQISKFFLKWKTWNISDCILSQKSLYSILVYVTVHQIPTIHEVYLSISDSVSSLSLKGTEYLSSLDADSHISLYVMATVKETSQVYLKREIYRVEQPNLELKVNFISTARFIWPNKILHCPKTKEYEPSFVQMDMGSDLILPLFTDRRKRCSW